MPITFYFLQIAKRIGPPIYRTMKAKPPAIAVPTTIIKALRSADRAAYELEVEPDVAVDVPVDVVFAVVFFVVPVAVVPPETIASAASAAP